jgi:hypothetical protein
MRPLLRNCGYALASWLLPFAASVAIFPLKGSNTPLFETLMAIVVPAVGVMLGGRYLRGTPVEPARAVAVGFVWAGVNVALDLLCFSWGPMRMSPAAYAADIGLAYLVYPIILCGLCLAQQSISVSPPAPSPPG